jgi:hypothetical protein
MTAARQQRKPPPAFKPLLLRILGLAFGLAVYGGIFAPPSISAAPSDRIVINALTGLAISGFDPVAYFVDAKPKIGRPDMELRLDGVVWRFTNEGNRAEFAAHSEVYLPSFGGYDPVALARGVSVPGHPLFWTVTAERLYLFYSPEARTAFLAEPGNIIARAMRKWSAIERTIVR